MGTNWKISRPLSLSLGASVLALASGITPAQAQAQSGGIGEVVVTAERRETRLQDTPLAVSAIGTEQLEEQHIDSVESIQHVTPNLTFGSLQNFSLISLRGIGSEQVTLAAETSVATFEDGVYLGQTFIQNVPSFDLERIEVLRGPQGTLYGRNSTGGAINFVSKAPSFDPEANVVAGVGDFNSFRTDVGVTGPILGDTLAARASVQYQSRDGYRHNLYNDTYADDLMHLGGRVALLFQPTDNFEVTLRADATNRNSSGPYMATALTPAFANGTFIGAPLVWTTPNFTNPNDTTDFYNDYDTYFNTRVRGVSGTAEWDVTDNMTLRSITAYRHAFIRFQEDNDGTDASHLHNNSFQDGKQFSQEFNLFGAAFDERLDWLFGAYYFREKSEAQFDFFGEDVDAQDYRDFVGAGAADNPLLGGNGNFLPDDPLTPVFVGDNAHPVLGTGITAGSDPSFLYLGFNMRQKSTSAAAFMHGAFHLTDATTFSAGVRYTHDEKDVVHTLHANIAPELIDAFGPASGLCDETPASDSWNATTGEVSLDHNLSDNMLVYGRWSRGFKAGGFNTGDCDPTHAFDPETLTSYEIGWKAMAFDRQLRTNLSIFHYDYKGFQFTRYENNASAVANAPGATVDGAELEFLIAPDAVSGLRVDGSLSWLSSEFGDFLQDSPLSVLDSPTAETGIQIGGNQLVRAPEWKANLGVQYAFTLTNQSTLTFRGETAYSDTYFQDVFNNDPAVGVVGTKEPSYTISNFRVIWEPADRDIKIQAFVENIEDTIYMFSRPISGTQGGIDGNASAPRTFGLSISASFGGS